MNINPFEMFILGLILLVIGIAGLTVLHDWEKRMHPETGLRRGWHCFTRGHDYEIHQRLGNGYLRTVCPGCGASWEQSTHSTVNNGKTTWITQVRPWTVETSRFYASMSVRLRPWPHADNIQPSEIQRD